MGRRALPKVDPNIDLSFHFKRQEDLAAPLSISGMFGRDAPLEIEIGSGKGMFLRKAATAHPERNYLGTGSKCASPPTLIQVSPTTMCFTSATRSATPMATG